VYQQNPNPTGSLFLSALLALIPLVAVLVLLGGLKWKAHWAGLTALVLAIGVAVFGYSMPVGQALNSAAFGALTSVLVVLWITFNAIWIYNLTVHSGHFAVLRRSFSSISDDQRVQAIVIAFSFGALLEALAGGGGPVAICSVMLIALGVDPMKAVALALIADTAPVAFGGMGNPITVLNTVTGLPADTFGAMTGRQVPILAMLVPFVLIFVVDGRRGFKQAWPAALVAGGSFAVTQYLVSNFWSYKLCDIIAAIVSVLAVVLLSRVWQPERSIPPVIAGGATTDSRRDVIMAFTPYAVIVVIFSLAQIVPIKKALDSVTVKFPWTSLQLANPSGKPIKVEYVLNWASATGSLLFLSGLITLAVLGIGLGKAAQIYGQTIRQFSWAILAILAVFSLSYVMNYSGQITTLGLWLAGTGAFFAFLSPVVGWFGVAITGTDAGSNALFGGLQVTAAQQLHVSPFLFGASNSSGGVMAKMISPQNLAIGTAAAGLVGREGDLFRKVFGWSLLLLLAMCVIAYLQSTPVLGWMVP
jgi:lactate permease